MHIDTNNRHIHSPHCPWEWAWVDQNCPTFLFVHLSNWKYKQTEYAKIKIFWWPVFLQIYLFSVTHFSPITWSIFIQFSNFQIPQFVHKQGLEIVREHLCRCTHFTNDCVLPYGRGLKLLQTLHFCGQRRDHNSRVYN